MDFALLAANIGGFNLDARSIGIGLCIIACVLIFTAPLAMTQFKKLVMEAAVEANANIRKHFGTDGSAQTTQTAQTTAEGSKDFSNTVDVNKAIQQRAAAYQTLCPKVDDAARYRWMSQGFDENQALRAYIALLESAVGNKVLTDTPVAK